MTPETPAPRLLFFANSSRNSTDGRRVREFRQRLRCAPESEVLYRDDHGKLRSIAVLLRRAHELRPALIYIELFAYSGLLGGILAKLCWGSRLGVGNGDEVFSAHWRTGHYVRAVLSVMLERFLRRYADLWVVWSPFYHRWLLKRRVRNVVCAPGAVNLDQIKPVNASALRQRLGLGRDVVVGVIGSLQYSRELDMVYGWDLIEALSHLRDLPIKGLIVGDGPGLPRLRDMARTHDVEDRLVFTGRIDHSALNEYYSAMDIGLVTMSDDLDARFTWTAKLPELLACNVFPIVTPVERSRRFLLRCGHLLPFAGLKDPAYPERLAKVVRELVEDPGQLARRRHGREIACGLMSFEVASRHLERGVRRAVAGC